jgi:acyl dehydratase
MKNVTVYEQLDEKRFREKHGLFLDDFVVGTIIEHRPGRTVTMTDNVWQSLISMNQHPIHIDEEYAKQTEFKKILVSSLVTFNIINGMTVNSMSFNAIANLGWDEVRLTKPVFVGDTLMPNQRFCMCENQNPGRVKGLSQLKQQDLIKEMKLSLSLSGHFYHPKQVLKRISL